MRIAGIGCRPGTPAPVLSDLLAVAEARAGAVGAVATIASREAEVARLGRPLRLVVVAGIETPTRSARVMALCRTGSVAEAAALSACGPGARLTLPRLVSRCGRATIAIAETEDHR